MPKRPTILQDIRMGGRPVQIGCAICKHVATIRPEEFSTKLGPRVWAETFANFLRRCRCTRCGNRRAFLNRGYGIRL